MARVSAADKFNEWWSKLHKVQGNIIKLKNEANEKADEEVHTISVGLETNPASPTLLFSHCDTSCFV